MNVSEGLEAIAKLRLKPTKIFKGQLYNGGKWITYLNLYCGFDIETSTIEDRAYMWIWQFSFWNGEGEPQVVFGRTWGEFTYFIGKLKRLLNLRETTRIIVWDANMSFEFGFIQHLFEWSEIFAKEQRQPLLARTGGIEFHEALSISGGNLAYLAETYCTTKKLVGDLDYNLLRTSKYIPTEQEINYCRNDVIILSEFSKFIFDTYIIPQKYIPLTKTAILRHDLKERAKNFCKDIEILYKEIKALYPKTKYDYLFIMQFLFRGGYVHGRYSAMLQEIPNVDSFDLKSSYPSAALKRYVPVTPFEDYKPTSEEDMQRCLNEYCCFMEVTFYGIESTTHHSIESRNKCINCDEWTDENGKHYNVVIDNGRINKAGKITVLLTELDFKCYDKFYSWEKMTIHTFQIAKRGFLPDYILRMFYEQFEIKESIDKESAPKDYEIQKTRVNGLFGLTVTRLQFEDVIFKNHKWDWQEPKDDYDTMISEQVLSPFWGIYIANWGRFILLHEILYPLRDYGLYLDTDSIKFQSNDYTRKVIAEFNEKERKRNEDLCTRKGFEMRVIGKLGLLEWETSPEENGIIKRFKSAGAKRYICDYANKGVKSTISGLGKKALTNYCKAIGKDEFEFFTNGMKIPSEYTGKLRAKYNDKEHFDIVTDVQGNTERMKSESSVALLPVDFSLKMEKEYYDLIKFWLERMKRNGN